MEKMFFLDKIIASQQMENFLEISETVFFGYSFSKSWASCQEAAPRLYSYQKLTPSL